MLIRRMIVWMLSVSLMFLAASGVSGQTYPNKPIRIVTSEPGGGNDIAARLIAQRISGPLGQQVIVDNRPSSVIPGELVAKAPPDGYTLLVYNNILWIGPLIQTTPYDAIKDFAPITLIGTSPNVLVVHPSVPANSVKDLIALAKARPGELNYSSGASGGAPHLAAELFNAMAGVKTVRVPYKGGAPAVNALIGGEVQLMFPGVPTVAPFVKSGRLKALAVTSAEPSALMPALPTVAESGLPGYESGAEFCMFAPAKTPQAIIKRLNQEVARFLKTAEGKERLLSLGAEAVGSSPEELAAKIKSDLPRLGRVIKDAGIRIE